jgi:hypothetical protein
MSSSQAGVAFELSSSDFSPTANQPSHVLSVTGVHELWTVTSLDQEGISTGSTLQRGALDFRPLEYDSPNSTGSTPVYLKDDLARLVFSSYCRWVAILRHEVNEFDLGNFSVTRSPFKKGMRALQKCGQGMVPSTLGEIFPLLLIGSILVNKRLRSMGSSIISMFVQDVLKWQYAITTPKEKELFLIGVDCLSRIHEWLKDPQLQITPGSYHSTSLTEVGQSVNRAELPPSSDHSISQSSFSNENSSPELLQMLKKGFVVTVCAQYLNCK